MRVLRRAGAADPLLSERQHSVGHDERLDASGSWSPRNIADNSRIDRHAERRGSAEYHTRTAHFPFIFISYIAHNPHVHPHAS